jgi:hypothetical protein
MPPTRRYDQAVSVREAFASLNLDGLRPLSELLLDDPPKKKADLVPLFAREMTKPARVRALYEQLDDLAQNAVRLAAHDPNGRLDRAQFVARYGTEPRFDTFDPNRNRWEYDYHERKTIKPTALRLFFPKYDWLPTDLRQLLVAFVPAPEAFAVPSRSDAPETVALSDRVYDAGGYKTETWEEPLRVRETALDAEGDVRAVLRLIDAGKVRVTDKKREPTGASREAVARVLSRGDFYTDADYPEKGYWDDADVSIKSFAWPVLMRVGGLAEKRGDGLKLTPAGRAALTAPAHETIRKLWRAWLKTREYDEFARVEVIRGQGKAGMSAVTGRREKVVAALKECPPEQWIAVEDFWRFMIATDRDFDLARDTFGLYIAEHYYGYLADPSWEVLQGRYTLAFLLEYAATLGLIDVGIITPFGARNDYTDLWGTDDLPFLSRYDGLFYLRINPLGAWCLGRTATYTPPARPKLTDVRVLANLDVVAEPSLSAVDQLALDKFADQTAERVWRLSPTKITAALETGSSLAELRDFLAHHAAGEIPGTVTTFLADIERRAERFTDEGTARVIGCADAALAAEVMADRKLKGKCRLADTRFLVVREGDLPAVKAVFRKLGHVWPIRDD